MALLGIVAIALEGAKILTWRKGGAHRVYAVALIILSGIASLGTSLQVVEKTKGALDMILQDTLQSSPAFAATAAELKSIDAEIDTLVERIQKLPSDYVTAAATAEAGAIPTFRTTWRAATRSWRGGRASGTM